jgi:ATP-binding cassette subfamily B (MDR/TAP) protein 1
MRYYEPSSGEILIDGNPIEVLDSDWLRHNITLVQQQGVLFNETIMQNISFGKRNGASRIDVKMAAGTACLEETISEMPNGLDTLVGVGGRSLSGGQTQRVAIARARLRDASILILDESTSALDHRNRTKVMEAIREWRQGKTTIIITHDMSQILDDDYVYVLEDARVVQEGYRTKLASKSHGIFASILQADDRESSESRKQAAAESEDVSADDSPKKKTSQRGWSRIFDSPKSSPDAAQMGMYMGGNNRMSLTVPMAHTSDLRAESIWSSPAVRNTPITSSPSWSAWLSPREVPPLPDQSSRQRTPRLQNEYQAQSKAISAAFDTPILSAREPRRRLSTATLSGMSAKPASLTEIFKTVWPNLTIKQQLILILGLIAATLTAGASPAFAFSYAELLSTYYNKVNQLEDAKKWATYMIAIAIIDGGASFFSHYVAEYVGQCWVNTLRHEALKRILAQPKHWFENEEHSPSRLNDCLDRNAEEMRNLIGRFAVLVFTVVMMLTVSFIWAFIISWKVTLVCLACLPVVFAVTNVFNLVSSKWESKCNTAADSVSTAFTETFANIRVVRALTLENYFGRKHRAASSEAYRVGLSRATYSGFMFGLVDGVSMFVIAVTFYYGGVLITNGSYTVGQILQVINVLNISLSNANSMIALVPQLSSAQATATQILYLSTLPMDASHEVQGTTRIATPFPIQMKNLSFTYSNSSTKTLNCITLAFGPGTCTAIVGPSGSGKSTIASILQGLYPPDSNAPFHGLPLCFNRIPILSCNFRTLRSFMAVVSQTPVLFPCSVFDNIIYGLREDSPFRDRLSAEFAAKKAGIHDFIVSLEQGYNTQIGEGGQGLSGGQAQRVAIARALVRKPKVLILDEATSALDTESAELIRDCIKRLVKEGVTVIMISHDVEMMRVAERIVVIECGKVVETGSFDELRALKGAFGRLIGDVKQRKSVTKSVGLGFEIEEMSPVEARSRDSWARKAL